MPRSVKKGPFLDGHLRDKVRNARATGGNKVIKTWSRRSTIVPEMIGFTFAMALSRFEGRREAVMHEANAIGTTALRARLLPPPHRGEALKLLQEYVKIRIDITERPRLPARTRSTRRCGSR